MARLRLAEAEAFAAGAGHGGSKSALLALVVELLCVALTGAAFGYEADGFFADEGNRPRLGQLVVAIDPGALVGQAPS